MANSVTASEIESVRFHLCYGNISVAAYPYTPDGFFEVFTQVVQPNLTTNTETSATTAIVPPPGGGGGVVVTVTPLDMTNVTPGTRLFVDNADDLEIVVVKSLPSPSSFSARFLRAHPATGYLVAVESGVARLRMLLHTADKFWQRLQTSLPAGIKRANEVEFYQGRARKDRRAEYEDVVDEISKLVRVRPLSAGGSGSPSRLEGY